MALSSVMSESNLNLSSSAESFLDCDVCGFDSMFESFITALYFWFLLILRELDLIRLLKSYLMSP